MKYSLAAVAALAALGQAAPTASSTSNTFKLKATSPISTYNDKYFGTCHVGAAIESLCLYDGDVESFHFEPNAEQPAGEPTNAGPQGRLIWDLPSGSACVPPDAQPMSFYDSDNSTENFGLSYALFGDGNIQDVAFNSENQMGIVREGDGPLTFTQLWYICTLNFEGYIYNTLSWVSTGSPPVARNCVAVTVTRE